MLKFWQINKQNVSNRFEKLSSFISSLSTVVKASVTAILLQASIATANNESNNSLDSLSIWDTTALVKDWLLYVNNWNNFVEYPVLDSDWNNISNINKVDRVNWEQNNNDWENTIVDYYILTQDDWNILLFDQNNWSFVDSALFFPKWFEVSKVFNHVSEANSFSYSIWNLDSNAALIVNSLFSEADSEIEASNQLNILWEDWNTISIQDSFEIREDCQSLAKWIYIMDSDNSLYLTSREELVLAVNEWSDINLSVFVDLNSNNISSFLWYSPDSIFDIEKKNNCSVSVVTSDWININSNNFDWNSWNVTNNSIKLFDNTPPVVSFKWLETMYVNTWESVNHNITAIDNLEWDISWNVIISWEWVFINDEGWYSTIYSEPWTFYLTWSATDSSWNTGTDERTMVVNATPSVSILSGNQTIDSWFLATLEGFWNDVDGNDNVTYEWSLNDGTVLSNEPVFTSPFYSNQGPDWVIRVALTVTDNKGASATDFTTITVNWSSTTINVVNGGSGGSNTPSLTPQQICEDVEWGWWDWDECLV